MNMEAAPADLNIPDEEEVEKVKPLPNILIHQASECEPEAETSTGNPHEKEESTGNKEEENVVTTGEESKSSSPETGETCPSKSQENESTTQETENKDEGAKIENEEVEFKDSDKIHEASENDALLIQDDKGVDHEDEIENSIDDKLTENNVQINTHEIINDDSENVVGDIADVVTSNINQEDKVEGISTGELNTKEEDTESNIIIDSNSDIVSDIVETVLSSIKNDKDFKQVQPTDESVTTTPQNEEIVNTDYDEIIDNSVYKEEEASTITEVEEEVCEESETMPVDAKEVKRHKVSFCLDDEESVKSAQESPTPISESAVIAEPISYDVGEPTDNEANTIVQPEDNSQSMASSSPSPQPRINTPEEEKAEDEIKEMDTSFEHNTDTERSTPTTIIINKSNLSEAEVENQLLKAQVRDLQDEINKLEEAKTSSEVETRDLKTRLKRMINDGEENSKIISKLRENLRKSEEKVSSQTQMLNSVSHSGSNGNSVQTPATTTVPDKKSSSVCNIL